MTCSDGVKIPPFESDLLDGITGNLPQNHASQKGAVNSTEEEEFHNALTVGQNFKPASPVKENLGEGYSSNHRNHYQFLSADTPSQFSRFQSSNAEQSLSLVENTSSVNLTTNDVAWSKESKCKTGITNSRSNLDISNDNISNLQTSNLNKSGIYHSSISKEIKSYADAETINSLNSFYTKGLYSPGICLKSSENLNLQESIKSFYPGENQIFANQHFNKTDLYNQPNFIINGNIPLQEEGFSLITDVPVDEQQSVHDIPVLSKKASSASDHFMPQEGKRHSRTLLPAQEIMSSGINDPNMGGNYKFLPAESQIQPLNDRYAASNSQEKQPQVLYIQTVTQCKLECPVTGPLSFVNTSPPYLVPSLPGVYAQNFDRSSNYNYGSFNSKDFDHTASNSSRSTNCFEGFAYSTNNCTNNNLSFTSPSISNRETECYGTHRNIAEAKYLEYADDYYSNGFNEHFSDKKSFQNVTTYNNRKIRESKVLGDQTMLPKKRTNTGSLQSGSYANNISTEHRQYVVREQRQTSIVIDYPITSVKEYDRNLTNTKINTESSFRFYDKPCAQVPEIEEQETDVSKVSDIYYSNKVIHQPSENNGRVLSGKFEYPLPEDITEKWNHHKTISERSRSNNQDEFNRLKREEFKDFASTGTFMPESNLLTKSSVSDYQSSYMNFSELNSNPAYWHSYNKAVDFQGSLEPYENPLVSLTTGMIANPDGCQPHNIMKPIPKRDSIAVQKRQKTSRLAAKSTESKKFICTNSNCTKRFSKAKELEVHIRKIHREERKPYFCSYSCPKSFRRPDQLKRHEKIHTGEKPHQCKVCGRAFARTDHRNTHSKKHNSTDKATAEYSQNTSISKPHLEVRISSESTIAPLQTNQRVNEEQIPANCSYVIQKKIDHIYPESVSWSPQQYAIQHIPTYEKLSGL